MYVLLIFAAGLCAYYAQRCFAGARGATGAGRLRWQARGLFLAAAAFGILALGLIARSPGFGLGSAALACAALVGGLVLRSRAGRLPPP